MNWTQISPYCLRSEDGAYTVCKIGGDSGFTYETWRGKEQLAVGMQTAEIAKSLALSHIDAARRIHEEVCTSVMERTP